MFRNFSIQIVASALIVVLSACSLVTTPAPTATPQPTVTAEPTQTPLPSATPEPSATFTSTPKPTNTPRPTNTATPVPQPGDVLFSDQFENNSNDWFEVANVQAVIRVKDGALDMRVKVKNYLYYSSPAMKFTDVDVTIEGTLVEGTNNNSMYGIQCRKLNNDNYYMAAISANGQYTITKLVRKEWKPIVQWTSSNAVKTGKNPNTIRLICSGEALQFWINNVRVVTVKDTQFKRGQIGLVTGTFDNSNKPNTQVTFDNLSVKLPEPVTLASGSGTGGSETSGGTAATQPPAPTASGTGQLIIVMCQGLETTVTIFRDGQIFQQHSLHNAGTNVYELPPGHYDVQFNATGYYNLNLAYDIVAGGSFTQYIGGTC